jgi:L-seryl-tRNA(Ser) seleniumtransferase
MQTYEDQVAWILAAFEGVKAVTARRSFPNEAGQPMPRAELTFNSEVSRDALLEHLMAGSPAISLAAAGENGVFINPQTLQSGEEKIVVERILEAMKVRV